MATAQRYERFARFEARGVSATYERLALAVSQDPRGCWRIWTRCRCAVLLPVLAALPQPLALVEVGASAGLCLYPDRYSYRYGSRLLGDSGPVLNCAISGVTPPAGLPRVVWRAGLDLNPLDVDDPTHVAWLEALIWPEHTHPAGTAACRRGCCSR